jgi:hypothetical protein
MTNAEPMSTYKNQSCHVPFWKGMKKCFSRGKTWRSTIRKFFFLSCSPLFLSCLGCIQLKQASKKGRIRKIKSQYFFYLAQRLQESHSETLRVTFYHEICKIVLVILQKRQKVTSAKKGNLFR